MDFEAFAATMEGVGEDLPNDLEQAMLEAAYILVEEIKNHPNFPVDSGALKSSLTARIIDGQFLGISMLDYGWFQNYGVAGTNNQTQQFGVDDIIQTFLPPRQGSTYSFNPENQLIGGDLPFGVRKSIHLKGLNGKMFFNLEESIDRIVELVNQNLEL